MKLKLTFFLLLSSIILIKAQNIELCKKSDVVNITTSSPNASIDVFVKTYNCGLNTTARHCANTAGYCVWDLGEECVSVAGTSVEYIKVNPLVVEDTCSKLSTPEDCQIGAVIGCSWYDSGIEIGCHSSTGGLELDRIIVDSVTTEFELAHTEYSYLLVENDTKSVTFTENELQDCGVVSAINLKDNLANTIFYQNPIKEDLFAIDLISTYKEVSFVVLDLAGRELVNKEETFANKLWIDTSNWSEGMYQVVLNLDGKTESFKVVK